MNDLSCTSASSEVSSPFHPHFFYTLNVCFPLPYISLPVTARAYIITIWVNMIYSVYTYECQLHWIPKLDQYLSNHCVLLSFIFSRAAPNMTSCAFRVAKRLARTWPRSAHRWATSVAFGAVIVLDVAQGKTVRPPSTLVLVGCRCWGWHQR